MHVYHFVAWQRTSYTSRLLVGADRIENSFLSTVASIRVYGAVAWQRVDQIRYNIILPSLLLEPVSSISSIFLIAMFIFFLILCFPQLFFPIFFRYWDGHQHRLWVYFNSLQRLQGLNTYFE
jgi:hypothetical protein